jgi:hypothetical protein
MQVRPAVPDYFNPATKYLAIAYAPNKRPVKALLRTACIGFKTGAADPRPGWRRRPRFRRPILRGN